MRSRLERYSSNANVSKEQNMSYNAVPTCYPTPSGSIHIHTQQYCSKLGSPNSCNIPYGDVQTVKKHFYAFVITGA